MALPHIYRDTNKYFTAVYKNAKTGGHTAKATPLQAGTGPEGSRRLRLPDFKTIGT